MNKKIFLDFIEGKEINANRSLSESSQNDNENKINERNTSNFNFNNSCVCSNDCQSNITIKKKYYDCNETKSFDKNFSYRKIAENINEFNKSDEDMLNRSVKNSRINSLIDIFDYKKVHIKYNSYFKSNYNNNNLTLTKEDIQHSIYNREYSNNLSVEFSYSSFSNDLSENKNLNDKSSKLICNYDNNNNYYKNDGTKNKHINNNTNIENKNFNENIVKSIKSINLEHYTAENFAFNKNYYNKDLIINNYKNNNLINDNLNNLNTKYFKNKGNKNDIKQMCSTKLNYGLTNEDKNTFYNLKYNTSFNDINYNTKKYRSNYTNINNPNVSTNYNNINHNINNINNINNYNNINNNNYLTESSYYQKITNNINSFNNLDKNRIACNNKNLTDNLINQKNNNPYFKTNSKFIANDNCPINQHNSQNNYKIPMYHSNYDNYSYFNNKNSLNYLNNNLSSKNDSNSYFKNITRCFVVLCWFDYRRFFLIILYLLSFFCFNFKFNFILSCFF